MLKSLEDVKMIHFPRYGVPDHELRVFQVEDEGVPFEIMRVFTVQASTGEIRGKHAHRSCNQIMVCLVGRCEVVCSDSNLRKSFKLDASTGGLWVPPGIWAEQAYLDDPSLLMVLCDRLFEEDDYFRDFQAYRAYRIDHSGRRT